MDEESFDIDPDSGAPVIREDFFKEIEKSYEKHEDIEEMKKRLDLVKFKLVEQMKNRDRKIRERRGSISSIGSIDRKRQFSGGNDDERSLVRSKPSTSPLS